MTVPAEVRPHPRTADEARAVELDDGLWQLRLPLGYTPDGTVDCYLLETRGGWCLVDCGSLLPPGWDALGRALDLAGVEPRAIELLVCTHAHSDHYALAAETIERCGCELALAPGPRASADVMRDPPVPWERRLELVRWAGVPDEIAPAAARHPGDEGYHPRPEPDRLLLEGDLVETRRGPWRVVPAPGHSPTQVVLFDERTRRLLSADLVLGGRIPYLEYGWTPDPWAEQRDSLARARALGAATLLPGHGAATTSVERLLDAAAGALEAAPQRLVESVGRAPRTAYEAMLDVLGPDSTFYRRHAALVGAVCILERLAAEGELDAVDENGIRTYHPGGSR